MKKFLLIIIIFFIFICIKISNEEYATTDSGKKVILHDNGTWEYYVEKKIEAKEEKKEEIEKEKYNKSENSKSEVKGSRKAYTIWYDNTKWTSSKVRSKKNNIEYEFSNLNKNSYAKIIYEKTNIPIDTLKQLIIFNAKKEGVNVQLLKSEYRNVNNQDLFLIKYSSIIKGYSYIFYGYIFSNKKGSYQFFTKTEASLFDGIKDDLDELINGLEIH